jgi:hypothetical protein
MGPENGNALTLLSFDVGFRIEGMNCTQIMKSLSGAVPMVKFLGLKMVLKDPVLEASA